MTRIGGSSSHFQIHENSSELPKLSSLDKLPTDPSQIRHNPIPLSELSKFIFPESISPSEVCHRASIKKEIDALLSIVALNGLKDGISGSA